MVLPTWTSSAELMKCRTPSVPTSLAAAYLAAIGEKKRGGDNKMSIVVSPTHTEASRKAQAITGALKSQGKLSKEMTFTIWLPEHLTGAKGGAVSFEAGTCCNSRKTRRSTRAALA